MDGKNSDILSREDAVKVLDLLELEYPDASCELNYDNAFQLIIAVVLSAQTTDVRVNKVTPSLFERYPSAKELAAAEQEDVQELIREIGMYKTKSKNIIALSKKLIEDFDGEVPDDEASLVSLPGVGIKTANVVLSEAFGQQRIAVDTHVFRVTNRIGLVAADNVTKTEAGLKDILPKYRWTRAHHLFIFHGRRCCSARKPNCDKCPLAHICLARNL